MAESFIMDDGRSIRALSKNQKGEENSAYGYRLFMLAQLRKHGGVMTGKQLEAALLRNYKATFGPDDRRTIGKRRKWQNTLDWAKAVAASKGQVATRSRQEQGKRVTYVVLLDPEVSPQEWIDWALSKPRRNSFRKCCPACQKKVPLGRPVCDCGYSFPAVSRRIDRVPRDEEE